MRAGSRTGTTAPAPEDNRSTGRSTRPSHTDDESPENDEHEYSEVSSCEHGETRRPHNSDMG